MARVTPTDFAKFVVVFTLKYAVFVLLLLRVHSYFWFGFTFVLGGEAGSAIVAEANTWFVAGLFLLGSVVFLLVGAVCFIIGVNRSMVFATAAIVLCNELLLVFFTSSLDKFNIYGMIAAVLIACVTTCISKPKSHQNC